MSNLTESQKRLIEIRVEEITDIHNRQTLRNILFSLFKKSEVGNRASEELEEVWGFVANQDYRDFAESNWS